MKNLVFLLTVCCLLLTQFQAQTPNFAWANAIGSLTGGAYFSIHKDVNIVSDAQGNIYTVHSVNNAQLYLSKYTSSGMFLWQKAISEGGDIKCYAMTIDITGNLYLTGAFYGTVDVDITDSVHNISSNGNADIFIEKLDSMGNLLWAKSFGWILLDIARGIVVDTAGFIYVTGSFSGTVDFDPTDSVYNLFSNGSRDVFVQKLDNAGHLVWASDVGGTSNDDGNSIIVDATGSIYVTGSFIGTVDFDMGDSVHTLSSNGFGDIFVQKLDSSGNFAWVRTFGGREEDRASSIVVDDMGFVYVTGTFIDTVDFDTGDKVYNVSSKGSSDIFVQKLDSAGNFVWVRYFGSAGYEDVFSIVIDNIGFLYVTGYFRGTVDFDPGDSVYNLSSNGGDDIFIQKLDSAGNFVWARAVGGVHGDEGNSIYVSPNCGVYVTGAFTSVVDFNPSAETMDTVYIGVSGSNNYSAFIMHFEQDYTDYTVDTTVVSVCDSYAWRGKVYRSSGVYRDTICGNVLFAVLDLTILTESWDSLDTIDACDSYLWRGMTYNSSAVYTDSLTSVRNCDSVYSLDLTILGDSWDSLDTLVACDSSIWRGKTHTVSGAYMDSLTRINGCDSVYSLELTIHSSDASTDTVEACDSYMWRGSIYTVSGAYMDSFTRVNGCDSVYHLELTIHSSDVSTDTVAACDSYIWLGNTFFSTGIRTKKMFNIQGCDSLLYLDLTILGESFDSVLRVKDCDSYMWRNRTYTSSGLYVDSFTRVNGCDSSYSLDLTIHSSYVKTDTVEACDSYSWHESTFMSTGIFTKIFQNRYECDSLLYLDLTIQHSSPKVIDTVVSCESFAWRGNTYTATAVYWDSLVNSFSCDSSFALDLTIIDIVDTTVTQDNILLTAQLEGGTYQWLDCGNNYAQIDGATNRIFIANINGEYAVEVTDVCIDTSACYTVTGLSIEVFREPQGPLGIHVYPSPTQGEVFIELDQFSRRIFVVVRDVFGRVLQKETIPVNATTNRINTHLETSAGVYYIEVSDEKGNKGVFRVVKQ